MAIARDDLGRHGLDRQAELIGDMFFDLGIDIGKGADRTRDGTGGDFFARGEQAPAATVEFGIGLRQLEAEGHRLGMDAVAAPDGRCVFVFFRTALDCRKQRVEIGQQNIGRAGKLHSQRGVEDIATGHALVHEPRLVAHVFRHPGEEGDHVMLGYGLDRVDRFDVDCGVGGPPVPQGLGRACRDHAEFAELFGRMRFDFEPDAISGFRLPQGGHFGAGVAGDHGELRSWRLSAQRARQGGGPWQGAGARLLRFL